MSTYHHELKAETFEAILCEECDNRVIFLADSCNAGANPYHEPADFFPPGWYYAFGDELKVWDSEPCGPFSSEKGATQAASDSIRESAKSRSTFWAGETP